MHTIRRSLWSFFALAVSAGIVLPMIAESPEERIGEALKRSLERSGFAVKRQAAELRDVADSDWGGFKMNHSLGEWRERLTAAQYRSTREKVADEPSIGDFVSHKEEGFYHCTCGNPLFHSDHKQTSAGGYPRFGRAAEPTAVVTDLGSDWSQEHDQVELLCGMCGAHLGHVDSGESADDDMAFVVNSSALVFKTPTSAESVD